MNGLELKPLMPNSFDDHYEQLLKDICESMGIPKRVFAGESSTLSDVYTWQAAEDERNDKLRQRLTTCIIEPAVDEWWWKSHRVKHVSVGQEKRDFFRALAKLSGIKQVNVKPKIVWKDGAA